MLYDRYAFQQAQLNNHLNELEQAVAEFEQAKKQRDTNSRHQAEAKMEQAASSAAKVEPHLAYLWYEAQDSELDNAIRDAWQQRLAVVTLPQAQKEEHFDFCKIPEIFRFTPNVSDAAKLPLFSFLLHLPFRLQTPYLSKDERDFYLLDNSLRREKIFKTPMVAATSWKGALRAALWQLSYDEDHEVIQRLFGSSRDSEDGQAGRLYFYPTFFNQLDRVKLEVINPHDRQIGVGARGPILMECVPKGAIGELALLYVPFGSLPNESDRKTEVMQDLAILVEGIQAMLTIYGFGAKTSSGFGLAEDRLAGKGTLALHGELPGLAFVATSEPEQATPALSRYLESLTRLHADFRQPDGSLKSESEYEVFIKSRGGQYTKKDKQLYEKAQKWWEREGRQLAEAISQEPAPTLPPVQKPAITELSFPSLSELHDKVKEVAR